MKNIYSKIIVAFLLLFFVWKIANTGNKNITVSSLSCEFRLEPLGLDVSNPRLSWVLHSSQRGEEQIACQILVASSKELLRKNKGNLWDSGKINSSDNIQVYAGIHLKSRQQCYWKVRVWDRKGKVSNWSSPAFWSMGLLQPNDWQALWISDQVLAEPHNRPLTPINCYCSELSANPYAKKWIMLDLGAEKQINKISLLPARPQSQHHDFRTFMYPLRFKIEVANDSNFSDAIVVVDKTSEDYLNPRRNGFDFPIEHINARYVKFVVTKLSLWDGQDYALALGAFNVFNNERLLSKNAIVQCSDSRENEYWSKKHIVSGSNDVKVVNEPSALDVHEEKLNDIPRNKKTSRVPMLRREFEVGDSISSATLYVTARGFYEFYINGNRISNDLLSPGFTDYNKRIAYQTYNVTDMIKNGTNAMGAFLGYGWYAGHMNVMENRGFYGLFPQLLAQLELKLTNGEVVTISTDKQWRSTLSSPVLWSDLLDGEAYDCCKELHGWSQSGFDDRDWKSVYTQPRDSVKLVWQRTQPVKEIKELKPINIQKVKPGVYVIDFGQEIAGWCKLRADGNAGDRITLRHAEIVDPDGNINVKNLWRTSQHDIYILDGKGSRVFVPHFTYHGFRYIEVSGLKEEPNDSTITAVSIHSDTPFAGNFECSNELFNRYMEAVRWTQWNMLYDIPAGCAARSERLAWLGDIRPTIQASIYNMDMSSFWEKYSQDIRDSQKPWGQYTDITPHAHLTNTDICVGSAGWADAGVSLPWQIYENYGNIRILKEHYNSAKKWVDFVHLHNPDLIWTEQCGSNWGDWLSAGAATPKIIGSTAFFAHSADLVSRMAKELGYAKDEKYYSKLFTDIKKVFLQTFVDENGIINETSEDTTLGQQGSYALALHFNLLDEPIRSKAAKNMVQLVKENNYHPTTGFWSSTELLLALSENGYNSEAEKMMNLETAPSWGNILKEGGTTFWESFDANSHNLSLNHWTHSGIGEWLWRNVAGLNPDPKNPGYKRFIVNPYPSEKNNWCNASYESVRGPIDIGWALNKGNFTMKLTVPVGSVAAVFIPAKSLNMVKESGNPIHKAKGVEFIRQENDKIVFEVKAGNYDFSSSL